MGWVGSKETFDDDFGATYILGEKVTRNAKNKAEWVGNNKIEFDKYGRAVKIGDKEIERDRNTGEIVKIGGEKASGVKLD